LRKSNYQLKRYINLSQQKPSKYIKNYYASIVPLIVLFWFVTNSLTLMVCTSLTYWNIDAIILKVSQYIEKFNVTKRYGITYGSFGLMSFTSFTKFILLYGELNMYWYQLMGNRKSSPQTY
ncbi:hypothetical protein BLOT_016812, partial [Blomia tropicalis]